MPKPTNPSQWPLTNPIPGTEQLQVQCNDIASQTLALGTNVNHTLKSIAGYVKFFREQPATRNENRKRIAAQFRQGQGLIPETNVDLLALWQQLQNAVNRLLDQIENPPQTRAPIPALDNLLPVIGHIVFHLQVDRNHPTDWNPDNWGAFEIEESELIMWVYTSPHDAGVTPGTINIVAHDGTRYGPWRAIAATKYADVFPKEYTYAPYSSPEDPRVLWEARPNVVLPPGTYTVLDSDSVEYGYNCEGYGIYTKDLPRDLKPV